MSNKKLHKGISLDYRKALEDEVFYYAEGNLDCIGLVNISDVKTNHPTPEQIGKVLGRAYRLWRGHCIKCGAGLAVQKMFIKIVKERWILQYDSKGIQKRKRSKSSQAI
jgi:hypothetical protein